MRGRKAGLLRGEHWEKIQIPSTTHRRLIELSDMTGIPVHAFCGMTLMYEADSLISAISGDEECLSGLMRKYADYMRFRSALSNSEGEA